jgi:hypothetical protein
MKCPSSGKNFAHTGSAVCNEWGNTATGLASAEVDARFKNKNQEMDSSDESDVANDPLPRTVSSSLNDRKAN